MLNPSNLVHPQWSHRPKAVQTGGVVPKNAPSSMAPRTLASAFELNSNPRAVDSGMIPEQPSRQESFGTLKLGIFGEAGLDLQYGQGGFGDQFGLASFGGRKGTVGMDRMFQGEWQGLCCLSPMCRILIPDWCIGEVLLGREHWSASLCAADFQPDQGMGMGMGMDVDDDSSLSSEQSQLLRGLGFLNHSHIAQETHPLEMDLSAEVQSQLALFDNAGDLNVPTPQDILNMSVNELHELASELLKELSEPLTNEMQVEGGTSNGSSSPAPVVGRKRKRVGMKCGYGMGATLREGG